MQYPQTKDSLRPVILFIMTTPIMVIFFLLFLFRKIGPIDFWWCFASVICVVIPLVLYIDREYIPLLLNDINRDFLIKILFGILSAGILFSIFFFGKRVARSIFPFADSGIREVYEIKAGSSPWKIVPLMVLIIGPGEELLWRGFIQKQYAKKYGRVMGISISVVFYTLIHIGTRNVMLILSAFMAGLYWGWLYQWRKSLLLNICSHSLWDLAVFVIFPLNN